MFHVRPVPNALPAKRVASKLGLKNMTRKLFLLQLYGAALLYLTCPLASFAEGYHCKQPVASTIQSDGSCSDPSDAGISGRVNESLSRDGRDMRTAIQKMAVAGLAERRMRCEGGDMRSCRFSACIPTAALQGPSEQFILCAGSQGLAHGEYWAILRGRPRSDSAALRKAASEMRFGTYINGLTMVCFRQKISGSEVRGHHLKLEEDMHVTKGGEVTFTFQVNVAVIRDEKTPKFHSLEALADQYCDR
jgi:hypothetical protein